MTFFVYVIKSEIWRINHLRFQDWTQKKIAQPFIMAVIVSDAWMIAWCHNCSLSLIWSDFRILNGERSDQLSVLSFISIFKFRFSKSSLHGGVAYRKSFVKWQDIKIIHYILVKCNFWLWWVFKMTTLSNSWNIDKGFDSKHNANSRDKLNKFFTLIKNLEQSKWTHNIIKSEFPWNPFTFKKFNKLPFPSLNRKSTQLAFICQVSEPISYERVCVVFHVIFLCVINCTVSSEHLVHSLRHK